MAEEKSSMRLSDINDKLSECWLQALEGVVLQGDIEINLELLNGAQPLFAQSLGREFTMLAEQLFDLSRTMGYPVDSMLDARKSGE